MRFLLGSVAKPLIAKEIIVQEKLSKGVIGKYSNLFENLLSKEGFQNYESYELPLSEMTGIPDQVLKHLGCETYGAVYKDLDSQKLSLENTVTKCDKSKSLILIYRGVMSSLEDNIDYPL
ncbi:hypothetical protein [Cetobacterium sp. SF1]|uniref:hypothetical protein n=1 Tax=Cetobacterium sp. SF1 TaxID=3417654 RepID=UPI003CF911FB